MRTLLPLCLFALTCSVAAAQDKQPAGHVFARVGNGVAFAKQGAGLGVGLGVEFDLGPRWAMRAEGEFVTARYDPDFYEAAIIERTNQDASTRSYALSASVLRYWTLGPAGKHRLGAGIGLLGRVLTMQSVTEATIGRDPAQGTFTDFNESIGSTVRDRVSLAPILTYRARICEQVSVGAFLRYEQSFSHEQEAYQTFTLLGDDGAVRGEAYGSPDYLDGPRAVSYGLTVGYALH